eukprot:gene17807-23417_t
MFFFSSFTDIGNGGELEFKDNKPEDKETVEIEDESKD